MKKQWKQFSAQIAAILLGCALLTSCTGQPEPPEPVPAEQESYETYDEQTLTTRKEFNRLMEEMFIENLSSSSLLDLQYTIKDKSSLKLPDDLPAFNSFSLADLQAATESLEEDKSKLAAFDETLLSKDQLLTKRILDTYIQTEQGFSGLELYYQPVSPTIGIQAQLPVLLSEFTLYEKEDVENYLTILEQLYPYYQQIAAFEQEKAQAGLMGSDFFIDQVIDSCNSYLTDPEESFLHETFLTRLEGIENLTEEEKESYKIRELQALENSFLPAYRHLIEVMTSLKGTGINEKGVCFYPKGQEYYEYLVRSATGTSYETIDDLKRAIEIQLKRDLAEMGIIISKNPELLEEQLDNYQFNQTEPTAILEELKALSTEDYPELPECNYTVKYVPKALETVLSPAFYLTPPIDDFKDNVIYINGNESYKNEDLYTVLAHEGYPGHLYQTVYYSNQCTHRIRHLLNFSSYSEGWATYVEHNSYLFDNGLDPNLGAVLSANNSASLSIHALADLNINYYGWDLEQTEAFLSQYFDVEGTDAAKNLYEAVIANPTNYLEYYVGYLEIKNMRMKAESALKTKFNAKEFHRFILDLGPAPFDVIQSYFTDWLKEQEEKASLS